MHAQRRPRIRTKSVTAKVTPEEETLLRSRAAAEGITLGEWSRNALLAAARVSPDTRLLLSEIMALRMSFLALHAELLAGGEPPTNERIKQVVDGADKGKFAAADRRIQSYLSQRQAASTGGASNE